jgi:hypothetical protein
MLNQGDGSGPVVSVLRRPEDHECEGSLGDPVSKHQIIIINKKGRLRTQMLLGQKFSTVMSKVSSMLP